MASADLSPSSSSEVENMAISNPNFAFDLHRHCGADARGKIVLLAPNSVSTALAMTCMGARGNTEKEMRQVLGWPADVSPQGFGSYLSSLKESAAEKTSGYILVEAQSIYVDSSFTLKPQFISDTQEHFASQVVTADFKNNPEGERRKVNDWASEQTQGEVRDLLPPGSIDSSTGMLVALGVYINMYWLHQFDPNKTSQANFYNNKGTVKVHMMKQTNMFKYAKFMGRPAVELPYASDPSHGKAGMVIVLPDGEGAIEDLDKLEADLNYVELVKLRNRMSPRKVKLQLPRFKWESSLDLKQALIRLGMPQAFGNDADFSGMVEEGELPISSFVQKTVVVANEEGTDMIEPEEGFTSKGKKTTGCMARAPAKRFNANHPFLFLIVDDGSNLPVLASGRVINPE